MKMFYYIIAINIIVLFCSLPVQSSSLKVIWHTGQVTLWNKAVLDGDLSYNWLAEMVMVRQVDGRIRTLSAGQVLQFGWFDSTQHKQRNFLTLPGLIIQDKPDYAFFEVCIDGPLAVVRRLRRPHGLFKWAFGHPGNYNDQPAMAQNTDQFDYYVHDAGRLLELNRFYADIYIPLMTAYNRQLQNYVIKYNINSQSLLGRLVLIEHYNFLVQQDGRTASAKSYGGRPN